MKHLWSGATLLKGTAAIPAVAVLGMLSLVAMLGWALA